jgi:hypothetical protein
MPNLSWLFMLAEQLIQPEETQEHPAHHGYGDQYLRYVDV